MRPDDRFRIPDSDMPGFAGVRMARGLQGRRGWRRWFALLWLCALVLAPLLALLR